MKANQRSPIRPDGVKSATGTQSAWGVILFALQCAQRIGQWITLLYIVHVVSTQVAVLIAPEMQSVLLPILDNCQPTYRLCIGAYFSKAAIENTLKIWTSIKSLGGSSTQTTSSDGNG